MLNKGSSFIRGVAQVGDNLDRPEHSAQAVLHVTEVQGSAPNLVAVWGRFGQEPRSFGQPEQFHARYANRATPHKRWRFRISLIWRVGT